MKNLSCHFSKRPSARVRVACILVLFSVLSLIMASVGFEKQELSRVETPPLLPMNNGCLSSLVLVVSNVDHQHIDHELL